MEVVLSSEPLGKACKHAVFLPALEGASVHMDALPPEDQVFLKRTLEKLSFTGRQEQWFLIPLPSGVRAAITGLGPESSFNLDVYRRDLAQAIRMVDDCADELALDVAVPGLDRVEVARAAAETAIMALYRFEKFKVRKERKPVQLKKVIIAGVKGDEQKALERAAEEGRVYGEQNWKARDLINMPAGLATPTYMANVAQESAKANGLKCTVLGLKELKEKKMHAVLAVGQGSAEEPKFVVLEWNGGKKGEAPIVLVGKGVCFDSGGLNIKSASGMELMKRDKSGAVAVLCALEGIARLKLKRNVVGIAPFVENMPSGTAYHPGDIVHTMSGKTIEIVNTDAEGRVILADALHYASQLKPRAIIDIATLTGACITALGDYASGMMGNDKGLMDRLRAAGDATYERVWEFPLFDEYGQLLKSDIADIRNLSDNGKSPAGVIQGGKFLEEFVAPGTPWAHLDIAGPSWAEQPTGYLTKGPSGLGVRLFLQLIKEWT